MKPAEGGLSFRGLALLLIAWKAPPATALWQALLASGTVGFPCAIGVHYPIGCLDMTHLAPAWAGAALFVFGIAMSYPRATRIPRPNWERVLPSKAV